MNKRQMAKKLASRELSKVVDELKEKTWDYKTSTSPDPELNTEILEFNEELIANNYVEEKEDGKRELVLGWYKKHTTKQIQEKADYFQDKLDKLLESNSYKATMRLADFLQGNNETNPYVAVELMDLDDRQTFVASMSKVRYYSFQQEMREGERPFIAIRSILADYDCRNQAMFETDCEY